MNINNPHVREHENIKSIGRYIVAVRLVDDMGEVEVSKLYECDTDVAVSDLYKCMLLENEKLKKCESALSWRFGSIYAVSNVSLAKRESIERMGRRWAEDCLSWEKEGA